jgi:phenylpyruvate tautomerase PptA (4-oxalocrotonate tautomerase family)
MTTPHSPAKYTAEQIAEIVARITELRMRWLDSVNMQIALQQEARMRTAATDVELNK